jgi:pimeloyl-ACP methyl ester carboxylesterase
MALIDVGGYRLDVRVTGEGSPAVVYLSSAGGAHDSWAKLVPLVSYLTAMVTYGRPGLAESDPIPAERQTVSGAGAPARELRALLRATDIPAPRVLVSGSVGGYIADQYAVQFPEEVAGLVLIDPSPPFDFPIGTQFNEIVCDTDDAAGWQISRRLFLGEMAARGVVNRDGRFVLLSASTTTWQRLGPRPWEGSISPDVIDAAWVGMQHWWATRLDAVQVVADAAGHHVALDAPELAALVVREVVAAARAGRPVQFDDAALAAVGGRRR